MLAAEDPTCYSDSARFDTRRTSSNVVMPRQTLSMPSQYRVRMPSDGGAADLSVGRLFEG